MLRWIPATHAPKAHCNSLQHTAPRCNILTLQHTVTHYCVTIKSIVHRAPSQYLVNGALHLTCQTLQHTVTHCNALQHTAPHCNTLQHNTQRSKVRKGVLVNREWNTNPIQKTKLTIVLYHQIRLKIAKRNYVRHAVIASQRAGEWWINTLENMHACLQKRRTQIPLFSHDRL